MWVASRWSNTCKRVAVHIDKPAGESLADLQAIDARIDERVFAALSVEASVAARASHGGTAPVEVEKRIAEARAALGLE